MRLTCRVFERSNKPLAWVVALLVCGFALTGCGGSSRSVAAVCHVWDTQGLELHDKFEATDRAARSQSTAGIIEGLASIIGAPGEIASLMHSMANVAPPESEGDFEAVASAFTKLSESESKAITDPLGALGSNLVESLSVSGSVKRVDRFLSQNCGIPTH